MKNCACYLVNEIDPLTGTEQLTAEYVPSMRFPLRVAVTRNGHAPWRNGVSVAVNPFASTSPATVPAFAEVAKRTLQLPEIRSPF